MNRTFHYRALAALLTVSTLLTGFASAQIVKPIPATKAYVDSEIAEEAAARIAADATKQPLDSDLTALAGFTLTANTFPARSSSGAVAAKSITDTALAFVASPTSANLAAAITDELGSGSALFGDQAVSTTSNARFAQLGVGTTASAYTFDVLGGDIRLSQGGGARTMLIDNQGMSFNTIATIGGTWSGAGMLEVVGSGGAPSRNGVYFRGAASQTGDAFLYRSSSSVDLARIKSDGGGYFAGPVDFAGAVLTGDAANIIAQRNGTNAQESRIYNTYTSSTNHERGILKWDANVFKVGTEKGTGGGTARNLALVTDGTPRLTIGATDGNATFAASVLSGAGVRVPADNTFYWDNRARLYSPADGVISLMNKDTNGFTRLTFGPATSSFLALEISGTQFQDRLADGSAFAARQSLYQRFGAGSPEGVVTAPIGAIYSRTDGGAGTSLYVKESGTGNTGWVAK